MQPYLVLLSLAALFIVQGVTVFECKGLDEWCDGTVFNRCCGDLRCQLSGFAQGTCKTCIKDGHTCAHDSHCCSGNCRWLRCRPEDDD
ncbi:hypothetical protein CRM22_008958 [Opisthorchis felineus]|uniref:UPF0506 domain-containing protein n=1 Tax=Opisthorchis felineus TaxID=147828 RepID=A0A4S2L9H6_OPIFE|nr:hypothetical protein CRM22_008958 [Opisthorchis felineus]